MPTRFISLTTTRPKSFRPWCTRYASGSKRGAKKLPAESAQWLVLVWVSVM